MPLLVRKSINTALRDDSDSQPTDTYEIAVVEATETFSLRCRKIWLEKWYSATSYTGFKSFCDTCCPQLTWGTHCDNLNRTEGAQSTPYSVIPLLRGAA